jgi:carbon storage regulator
MLVLSRKRDESIIIGGNVVITIVDIRGDKVRLGITAPAEVSVHRKEIHDALQRERAAANPPAAAPATSSENLNPAH